MYIYVLLYSFSEVMTVCVVKLNLWMPSEVLIMRAVTMLFFLFQFFVYFNNLLLILKFICYQMFQARTLACRSMRLIMCNYFFQMFVSKPNLMQFLILLFWTLYSVHRKHLML